MKYVYGMKKDGGNSSSQREEGPKHYRAPTEHHFFALEQSDTRDTTYHVK